MKKIDGDMDRQIRRLADQGISVNAIAERFGISKSAVRHRLRKSRDIAAKRPERMEGGDSARP